MEAPIRACNINIHTHVHTHSWICEESSWKHQFVPKDLVKAAADHAKAALEEDMDD